MAKMNGWQHFEAAEHLMEQATKPRSGLTPDGIDSLVAMAQVHATLALAHAALTESGRQISQERGW